MRDSDANEVERLSSSSSFLRLADSILPSLDRGGVAELLAGYLYFKSKGRTDTDFVLFMATRAPSKGISTAIRVTAALIPGLLFDKEFRSVLVGAALRLFIGRQKSKASD